MGRPEPTLPNPFVDIRTGRPVAPPRPPAGRDPNREMPGGTAPWWRWIFYALAAAAIPIRLWWDAPLLCAHFGWFCR